MNQFLGTNRIVNYFILETAPARYGWAELRVDAASLFTAELGHVLVPSRHRVTYLPAHW